MDPSPNGRRWREAPDEGPLIRRFAILLPTAQFPVLRWRTMSKQRTVSRRELLKSTALAAAGGATLLGQTPAVITARRFRAWVTRGGGTNRTTLQELTLRPVTGRQLVVRTEATNLCYSNVGAVLGPLNNPAAAPGAAPRG